MPKLVATKPLTLSGRRVYQPGDEFEVRTTAEARALKAIGKARDMDPETAERAALRQRAAALGIETDGRWGAARLREEIAAAVTTSENNAAAAHGRYLRRDMRAEDDA